MNRIYFDYAASTPVDKQVVKAMEPYFTEVFGNPSSLHQFGQEASAAIFKARQIIAAAIGANYKDIIFTGSATEANNLALRGIIKAFRAERLAFSGKKLNLNPYSLYPRIIVSAIEHESVFNTCLDLEREGVEVIYIPVSQDGTIDIRKLEAALNERTILVSVMYVNNEVGTIQPIREIGNMVKAFRVGRSSYPLFHTDAVQAFQYLDCDVNKLGVDLMTLSAHKIYGPKGIGMLYVSSSLFKNGNYIHSIITGGGQERGLRSGTPNISYIVGFAKAVEINEKLKKKERKRIGGLRDYLWRGLQRIAKVYLNGSYKKRIPNNLDVYFYGHTAGDLLIKLDLAGIAVSPGAACLSRAAKTSYVLKAMGFSEERCGGSLRISLGRQTAKKDIDAFLREIKMLQV